MNIKKIIRESLDFDNFDWLDTNTDNISGQELYDIIQNYFKENHNQYWLEDSEDETEVAIMDDTGRYFMIHYREFSIPYLVKKFEETINNNLKYEPEIKEEYIRLAKALEPIIGPIRMT